MSRRTGLVQTRQFAERLITEPNEYVRWWQFGRLSIVWDIGRPVPEPVPTGELIPNEPQPFRIEDTCCGRCPGDTCYVDYLTGEREA